MVAVSLKKKNKLERVASLTAEEAKGYGIIDTVLEYRKLSAQKV